MAQAFSADVVLQGYCNGVFPMGTRRGRIDWYSPDPRGVFEFETLRISRSLRKTLSRGEFDVRVNTAFRDVMAACGDRGEGTWITPPIARVYHELHERGFAHSVETWQDGRLVGGLYGVAIGAAYFGESMFHRATDASKVALMHLMMRLQERGYELVDTQWVTPHLASLGAVEIPRSEYLRRLAAAIRQPRQFSDDSPAVGVRGDAE